MKFMVENWYILFALFILFAAAAWAVVAFFRRPTAQQIHNFKQWLRFAVVEAEKKLGAGTGQLKLRTVYDWAVSKFPWVGLLVDFDDFALWVDEALDWMANALMNEQLQSYVDNLPGEVHTVE